MPPRHDADALPSCWQGQLFRDLISITIPPGQDPRTYHAPGCDCGATGQLNGTVMDGRAVILGREISRRIFG